jgi:hypothetical protein
MVRAPKRWIVQEVVGVALAVSSNQRRDRKLKKNLTGEATEEATKER